MDLGTVAGELYRAITDKEMDIVSFEIKFTVKKREAKKEAPPAEADHA